MMRASSACRRGTAISTTERRIMDERQNYVGLEEAARLLGVGYWRVRYAHTSGRVPEPPRIAGRRVYDPTCWSG